MQIIHWKKILFMESFLVVWDWSVMSVWGGHLSDMYGTC